MVNSPAHAPLVWAALLGALLVGCTDVPTPQGAPESAVAGPVITGPATPTATVRSLGLYELQLEQRGGQLRSSVTRVGGEALGAQEVTGLQLSAATATVGTAGTERHLSVSVTVTNQTGADVARPTFVPVAVNGYTQNGTYFREAQDSTGAPSDPSGILIEQATTAGSAPARDVNATPLIGRLDASALNFDLPAGTSVSGVSPYGWQSPTLSTGTAQTVTFGLNAGANPTYRLNLVFGIFDGPPLTTTSAAGTALFTEYVEGSSNNKALEIYNASQATIPGGTLSVKLYNNGGASASNTLVIGKTLIPGETYVIANSQGSAQLKVRANAQSAVTGYNGDDALTLDAGGTLLDSIGQVGFDPGTAWTGSKVSTLDQTLQRRLSAVTGDLNAGDPFDPSAEWESLGIDTFSGLGYR